MEWLLVAGLLVVLMLCAAAPLLMRRPRKADPSQRRYAMVSRDEPLRLAPIKDPFDFADFPCAHDRPKGNATVTVHGHKIGITDRVPLCPPCFEAWLNKHATHCASCNGPILPGMPVAQAWLGAPYPHTHASMTCCDSGGLFCGIWGQGRLITLHEMDPEKYPAGSGNVMDAVLKSGKPIVQNFK